MPQMPQRADPTARGDLAAEIRGDFPALRTDAYMGVPLIYLDSGARALSHLLWLEW
jgi:hypothetical protein